MANNYNSSVSFDSLAKRYDLANRLISCGMDMSWRRRLISQIPDSSGLRMLDLATGTGDIAIMASDRYANIANVTALDNSQQMLNIARAKAAGQAIDFMLGDIHNLPFEDGSFDCITLAFGLRNASAPQRVISEIYRVLSPGGTVLILEFTMPEMLIFKWFFYCYFRFIMPAIGGAVTGDLQAYKYLFHSVKSFYRPKELKAILVESGFEVGCVSMALSTVWLYNCQKKG